MSSRPVCAHFLKGTCRYGDQCRNSHDTGGGSQSGFQQNRSGGGQQRQNSGSGSNQQSNYGRGSNSNSNQPMNQRGGSQYQNESRTHQNGSNGSQSRYQDQQQRTSGRNGNGQPNQQGDNRNGYDNTQGGRQQRNGASSRFQTQSSQHQSQQRQGRGNNQYQNGGYDQDSASQSSGNSNRRQRGQSDYYGGNTNESSYQQHEQSDYTQQGDGYRSNRNQRNLGSTTSGYDHSRRQSQQQQAYPSNRGGSYQQNEQRYPENSDQTLPTQTTSYQQRRQRHPQQSSQNAGYSGQGGYDQSWSSNDDSYSDGPYGPQNGGYPQPYSQQSTMSTQRPSQRYGRGGDGRQGEQFGFQGQSDNYGGGYPENPYQPQRIVLQYDGPNTGRAWYTRGDGSRLSVPEPHLGRPRGFGNGFYDPYSSSMQVDGDSSANLAENGNEPVEGSNQALTQGDLHAPSPLYSTYYSKAATIPSDQLGLYQGDEFAAEIPEDPPPFEHCYAPGQTPKQFEPKTNPGN